jgi:hypothetical protein
MKVKKQAINELDDSILSLESWKNDYMMIKEKYKESQYDFYKRNNAPSEVLDLVSMESKRFGSIGEKIIINIFKLGKRTSSENDGVRKNKKIEIKCARYWSGKIECRWQHLEIDHDYDCVLFVLLDFDGSWKVWAINKSKIIGELREKKIVTDQGKQGYWCEMSKVKEYCLEIRDINMLDNFLESF